MKGTALILGANGRFGRHASEAFWNAGWQVRHFTRGKDDLKSAATGADVIVNGWNPPYDRWSAELPVQAREIIAAARTSGATVLIPGNVYVFGSDAPAEFGQQTPHGAANPLGKVRIDMETTYRSSGVRTIVLRAGDFLDTDPSGNWFDRIIAARVEKGVLSYPGNPDIPHAWAYLPDMADAAVRLCEIREQLNGFEDVPFSGYTLSGNDLAKMSGAALGRPVEVRRMNWMPLRLASLVWPMARGILEMRYLWDKPHHLDDGPLSRRLPDFRATDEIEAFRSVLAHKIDPDKPVSAPNLSLLAE